ncbi:MAG: LptF/LptG family permease [bacterium]|nr:LptF/LptG family permease [bacterium]
MRRFNLYILWEIFKLFFVALVAFTTVISLAGIAQQLVSQGLGPKAIVELLPYILPISLQYALPATLLFAVCSVYGRISADAEVLAVMAAGVPPWRIISPALIASFLLSLVAVWINDVAFSWGKPGINRVIMHSIEQVVYGFLSTQGSYTSEKGLSIHVHGIGEDGRELILPTITTTGDGDGEPFSISARSARLTMDPVKDVLRIEMVDSIMEGEKAEFTHPGLWVHEVLLPNATKKGTSSGHPSEVPIRKIAFEKRKQRETIEKTQEIIAARTALGLGMGRYDWLDNEQTHESLNQILQGQSRLQRLQVEPWRRWAQGFSCFFFVWVAIPFSIWMKSADHWTSFGACFMPILLVYYPVFAIGLGHAKDGSWPVASVWLGNIVLLVIGVYWLRRLQRT